MTPSRRHALFLAACASACLVWPRAVHGDDPVATSDCSPSRIDRALADVARARAGVTTLTGPFTQERTIGLLAAKVRSTGTFTLVRPDRLRWELAPPDDVVYWVTPEGLAYKSPSGQGRVPAASQRVAAALSDLRVLLGGDLSALRGRYTITGTCRGDDVVAFRAIPKAETASSFQEIRFSLAPDLVSPVTTTIVEGPRDRTEIRFGATRTNVPVPPATMSP
jgi:outer membrane lipoprotein-sorting protein